MILYHIFNAAYAVSTFTIPGFAVIINIVAAYKLDTLTFEFQFGLHNFREIGCFRII